MDGVSYPNFSNSSAINNPSADITDGRVGDYVYVMKKKILVGLFLFCLANAIAISAYPKLQYMGGVNSTKCINNLASINSTYFEGVKLIRFYPELNYNDYGYYFLGTKVIQIMDNCNDKNILIHELAHNCRQQYGKSTKHDIEWQMCYYSYGGKMYGR